MDAIILKTKPYSIFRLGSGSLNEADDIIHSDTLFSAMVSVHSQVFDDTIAFIDSFDKGEIKISSAFPMLADAEMENKIFFLPKPELTYSAGDNAKEEKRIEYISLGSLTHLQNIIKPQSEIKISFTDKNYFTVVGSSFSATKTELESSKSIPGFISKLVIPKTKVHSTSQENSFYHETDIQLMPINIGEDDNSEILNPHFYFLYELNCSEEVKNEFFTCLRILADEGIGGQRSTGKGQFEGIIETKVELMSSSKAQKYLLLSLSNPASQDEFDVLEKYEILIRGGGSVSIETEDEDQENKPDYSDYRKKQVRMIAEGAVMHKDINGRLVDISPNKGADHNYYRNGKSFTIPLG